MIADRASHLKAGWSNIKSLTRWNPVLYVTTWDVSTPLTTRETTTGIYTAVKKAGTNVIRVHVKITTNAIEILI